MLRFTVKILLYIFVTGVLSMAGLSLYIIPKLPDIETLRDVKMQVPLRVYSLDGSLIAEFGEKRRQPIRIEEVPRQMIEAILAAEDDRFYEHPGVDWQGILRAAINLILTGEKSIGGSTITMQVAKNFFLSFDKLYIRKITEIFLALKIEQELSKDEILELYLNKIFLGHRAYGVGAAAQVYYGKEINNLGLAQIAMIAGMAQRPSPNNPVTNPEKAILRRNYVLGRMLEQGYITNAEYESARQAPVTESLHSPNVELEAPYVAEMVRSHMVSVYGENAYNEGFRVYTTIRDRNQVSATHALRSALHDYDRRHGFRGVEYHVDLPEDSSEQDWIKILNPFPEIGGLQPALVTAVDSSHVSVYINKLGTVNIDWEYLEWARKYITENRRGRAPETAGDILQRGDVIRVSLNEENKWQLMQIPEVEGALVSVDPSTGSLLALVGGYDFQRSKFNRIIQARRQPGSSFKPFIYSAALEEGFTAASLINDAPVIFDDPGIEDTWRPENYSGKYYGPTRMREALIHSRNLVSIRLLDEIGVDKALQHIKLFGYNPDDLPHGLSLALGSGEVTPWQHISAYSVLANGGYWIEPYFIDRIEQLADVTVFQATPMQICHNTTHTRQQQLQEINAEVTPAGTIPPPIKEYPPLADPATDIPAVHDPLTRCAERVVDAGNIWILDDMMRDVILNPSGTGRRARVLGRKDLSGKTGTTNDQSDAWFAGFNTNVATIAWVGFDDYQRKLGNNETGGVAALPMWIDYMRAALEGIPESILERPSGLVNILIDPDSGRPANAGDPKAIFEVFRLEHQPGENPDTITPEVFDAPDAPQSVPEELF